MRLNNTLSVWSLMRPSEQQHCLITDKHNSAKGRVKQPNIRIVPHPSDFTKPKSPVRLSQVWLMLLLLTWNEQMNQAPSKLKRKSIIQDYWHSREAEVFTRFFKHIHAQTASGVRCCFQSCQCQVMIIRKRFEGQLAAHQETSFNWNRCLPLQNVAYPQD